VPPNRLTLTKPQIRSLLGGSVNVNAILVARA
jgi:hypothetical protein